MELQKTVQSYSGQKVQVNAIPITEALAEFVDWLISLQGEIVLLGHNAKYLMPHIFGGQPFGMRCKNNFQC